MSIKHVVSVSGGKDSAATLLIALHRFGHARVVPIFCDTGNEHEQTYEYLGYLESALGVVITRLRADFSEQLIGKRMFIARDVRKAREYKRVPKTDRNGQPVWKRDKLGEIVKEPVYELDADGKPTEVVKEWRQVQRMGWDAGRKVKWSNKAKRRALSVMQPSGNPFLDLCMWKGRFPSRKAQFCTEELKTNMAVEFQLALIEQGHKVVSWQGVRRDESFNRRNVLKFEAIGGGMFCFRPIADWSAADVFAFCALHGLKPNPLYLQDMTRVGCMPCINVNKPELKQIALRFGEHLVRISDWEWKVSMASKRGFSTFMADAHAAKDRRVIFAELNIWERVRWANTSRGGRQFSLIPEEESKACSSAYGLCE
jgi:3'-phosphoadenosine 5'-phosphosulfate sulfotransferase (PAPS reductase)/FAD synthetase